MKYIRTKDGIYKVLTWWNNSGTDEEYQIIGCYTENHLEIKIEEILNQADTIEELCDEFVLVENENISAISFLAEAKDRLLEYHENGNQEVRLIGRIKVGLDSKAVAEFKELTEGKYKGCYDWVLL